MVSTTLKNQQPQTDKSVTIVWHSLWEGVCIGNSEPRRFQVHVNSGKKTVNKIVVYINGVALDERHTTKHHKAIREAITKFENFKFLTDEVRDKLDLLPEVGASSEKRRLKGQQQVLYLEWTHWIESDWFQAMPQATDKKACNVKVLSPAPTLAPTPTHTPATYAEWEAIPKPRGWKHCDGWWIQSSCNGRYNRLPDSVQVMYKLSDRQVLILEGAIEIVSAPVAEDWEDWMEGFSGEILRNPAGSEDEGEESFMIRPEYMQ